MKLPLSNRLLACCQFLRPGDRVADIGCDHGYLGIHLLLTGAARSVIAADVNPGPLASARRNAEKYGLRENIAFYLSDGAAAIPRDFDVMVCAGMGADTMISILEKAPWLRSETYRLVLQCQSKQPMLRKYLSGTGWYIAREALAQDGKFIYPVMEVLWQPGHPLTPAQCYITPALEQSGSELLGNYIRRVLSGLAKTAAGTSQTGGEGHAQVCQRIRELEEVLNRVLTSTPTLED